MKIEKIKNYIENIDLGNYELDGVEITEDDYIYIQELTDKGMPLEEAIHQMLCQIRKVLDWGLEEEMGAKNDEHISKG